MTISKEQAYTYSRYSELQIDPIDLCEYFGYQLTIVNELNLPALSGDLTDLPQLQQRLRRISTRLISRNEQSKREMLVAPIIEYVVEIANALVRIEYPVKVSHQLQGTVDYLLSIDNLAQLLVIEAKRDDLDYGFSQLMAELIALDQWERSPSRESQPVLLGAITTGGIWQFALLHRQEKRIQQGVRSFRSPEDLDEIVRSLVGSLRGSDAVN